MVGGVAAWGLLEVLGEAVEAVDQAHQCPVQFLRGQPAQGFQDGPDPVPGHGPPRSRRTVYEGGEGRRNVQVAGLDPVGQRLVAEAVAGPGGYQQPFGEHGRGPAGAPGEQFLEGGAVQLSPAGPQAPAGGLVHPARHPCREPPDARAVHPGGPGPVCGDPDGRAQAEQVQVGGEDLVPAGAAGGDPGRTDPGEQAQGERMAGVGRVHGVGGDAQPGQGGPGLGGGEVAEGQRGRQPPGGAGRDVQVPGRVEGPGPFPVLGPGGDDHAGARGAEPGRGGRGPGPGRVRQFRRRLLRGVQDDQQAPPGIRTEPRHPLGDAVLQGRRRCYGARRGRGTLLRHGHRRRHPGRIKHSPPPGSDPKSRASTRTGPEPGTEAGAGAETGTEVQG